LRPRVTAAALRSRPPRCHVECGAVERLDPSISLVSVHAELDPATRFESIRRERSRGEIDDPVVRHPDPRVVRLLYEQVMAARGGRQDLADPVGDDLDRLILGKRGETLAAPASDTGGDFEGPRQAVSLLSTR